MRIGERPALNSPRTQSRSRLTDPVNKQHGFFQLEVLTALCHHESQGQATRLDEDIW